MENLAEKAFPFYELLKNDSVFEWTNACETPLSILKNEIIINATKLNHYDETKELILATDASENGIGAALLQNVDDSEKPSAHASKALTETQKRNRKIEKEALFTEYQNFINFCTFVDFN